MEAKRERILGLITKDNARAGRVFDGLGHGYAMRAYSRLKHMTNRVGDERNERLAAVEKELKALGWRNPQKPVETERTEEEQMRHYCEVMGLSYEEVMAQTKERETAKITQ